MTAVRTVTTMSTVKTVGLVSPLKPIEPICGVSLCGLKDAFLTESLN
ncbi:MAG: hypothetical protein H3C46_04690 [Ignavibacteria bacterium]|nr:hypothetical protein [Ignavibacteria bacterium]